MGSMMESLLQEGRRYGRKVGRLEGRDEAQRSAVARMLAAGKLTFEKIALYAGLSLEEVRALADRHRDA